MTVIDPGSYLELEGGRPAVRFERVYDHPIDRVWALVSEPAELAYWFPFPEVAMEPVVGGEITFSGDSNMPEVVVTGEVTAFEPPHLLAFTWGGDALRFELTRLDAARTRLTLTDFLDSADAAARNAAGWDLCLAALDARAAGGSAAPPAAGAHDDAPADPPAGRPSTWRRRYDAYVAAGLPKGAPIPGGA
ncbi:Uncharacterized conserved protein YndB, AHSA1/START domain [Actinacidiphila yanglinensis]|uniref:Uncharacterized conserved protein YndB, AHSA1/START domain n=1 Tax=Actinacidiphila yanglinensis TaxID=310779 RepID=A0A1H6DSP3_9ACTN|nr:SRPBCC family protein [Actinacidiphila yanglinensis]SEG88402.1 Uncharacterized conserved protein YndB, AHSA1/START domain [Actinacidiphila yanglinensis]